MTTKHAGRRSLIVAILGTAVSLACSEAVAAAKRTGHRLATLSSLISWRRPAPRDVIAEAEPFYGDAFVPVSAMSLPDRFRRTEGAL